MALEDITLRIGFLMFVAVVVTILLIMSCTAFWDHSYQQGALFLSVGAGLGFAFFRKRKIALAIVGLSFIFVSAGVTALFHPSVTGILLTAISAAGTYFISLWDRKRAPNQTAKDWKTLFD